MFDFDFDFEWFVHYEEGFDSFTVKTYPPKNSLKGLFDKHGPRGFLCFDDAQATGKRILRMLSSVAVLQRVVMKRDILIGLMGTAPYEEPIYEEDVEAVDMWIPAFLPPQEAHCWVSGAVLDKWETITIEPVPASEKWEVIEEDF